MSSSLLVNDSDRVRRLSLNRPAKRNALSVPLIEELLAAIDDAETDPTISCILITGEGPAFCGGYDVTSRQNDAPDNQSAYGRASTGSGLVGEIQKLRNLGQLWRRMWESPMPIVVAAHGYCVAGGLDLVLHADLLVCSSTAKFGYPAVRSQGAPPTNMWEQRVGLQWAKRLLLTGDLMSGETAAEIGLALWSVEPDRLLDEAHALASRIALVDKNLLMANKLSLNVGADIGSRSSRQDLAAIFDAVAHQSGRVDEFWERADEVGTAEAWRERNSVFAPDTPI